MRLSFVRFVHCTSKLSTAATDAVASSTKSSLAKLRKSTGYSFSKCKEALEKHGNDLSQAEKWLRSQAQAHGWEKATKLQGRATAQGLVSILSSPNHAVMLEVNCETDFVARNKKFVSLMQRLTQACYSFSAPDSLPSSSFLSKSSLSDKELSSLQVKDSKTLSDEIALSIGELGENIKARRAVVLKTAENVFLAGYTHPAAEVAKETVQSGKYGAIVAFRISKKPTSPNFMSSVAEYGRQLCQHIVGMNPKEIGKMDEIPQKRAEEEEKPVERSESPDEFDEQFLRKQSNDDETILLNQEFLIDPDLTVREFLIQNSLEVLDFIRYECGENIES